MTEEIAVKKEETLVLTSDIVKKYICPTATDSEIYFFVQLCKAQKLNPFLKEVYLIKYGTSPAAIVTGKEAFMKRADGLPQFDGFKAGIIVVSAGNIIQREGSFYIAPEIVVGGWADVFRKDRAIPFHNEVKLDEYVGKKADGTPNKMWAEKVATMIRKVALCQSLREAFPDAMAGLYSVEEINTIEELPKYNTGKPETRPPQAIVPETIQVKTSIVSAMKEVTKNKTGPDAFLYKLGDKMTTYTTDREEFKTLAKTAKDAGLMILLSHKNDLAKTIVDIEILEPDLDINSPAGLAGLQEASDALTGA